MDKKLLQLVYRRIFSLPALLLLATFCIVVTQGTFSLYKKNRQVAEQLQNSERDLHILKERRNELKNQIDHLSTEKGQEIEARRKFDLGRPGEKMIIIVEPKGINEVPEEEPHGFMSQMGKSIKRFIHMD
ncbi:MAG: septum formation initiator family protein [Minisyncoccia bacterium]